MKINIPNVDTQNIECIIFDLGGVILNIDFEKTIQAFDKFGIEGVKGKDVLADNQELFLDLELGLITPKEFVERFYTIYPSVKKVSDIDILDAWNALLQSYDKPTVQLIRDLKKHYKTYLLSNTNLPHRIRFREMYEREYGDDLEALFLHCFYSDEMHLRKPNSDIYEEVTRTIAQDGKKILFIDDSLANVETARYCGWNAYHLNGGKSVPDLFIR